MTVIYPNNNKFTKNMPNSSTESNFIELLIPKMDVRKIWDETFGISLKLGSRCKLKFGSTMQIKNYNQNQN